MKNEDTGSMEQDIVNEESVDSTDSPQKKGLTPQLPKITVNKETIAKLNLKTAFTFSKTKLLALAIIFVLLIVTFILIIVLGSKKPNEIVLDPEIQIASPEPKSSPNPEFQKIQSEIDKFKNKVDLITNQDVDIPPPDVDLNITF